MSQEWKIKEGKARGVFLLNDANGKAIGELRGSKKRAELAASAPELLGVLRQVAAMFLKGHAISNFNWKDSALTAENIQELNEIPNRVNLLLRKLE